MGAAIGAAIAVVASFLMGLRVKPTSQQKSMFIKQRLATAVFVGIAVGVTAYFVAGMRGGELVLVTVCWALILPAVLLGQLIQRRGQANSQP